MHHPVGCREKGNGRTRGVGPRFRSLERAHSPQNGGLRQDASSCRAYFPMQKWRFRRMLLICKGVFEPHRRAWIYSWTQKPSVSLGSGRWPSLDTSRAPITDAMRQRTTRSVVAKPAIDVRQRPMHCNGFIFPPPDPEHQGCCALLQPEKTGGAQFGLMAAAAVMPK